jgi:ABC-type nitrate/sulfonate/bicarbonate transport system permease component
MRDRIRAAIAPALAFAAVLVLWQASVWLLRPPPFILPGIDRVVARLIAFGPGWVTHIVATIEGIALGFLAAVVLGSLGAVLIVASDTVRRAITPLLVTV